eukprot:TRINITY_DN56666_c0_g1_i1.p1 TRINITY_DN56666_c0_g1~~TRINITY_DN56666_c0_g1_i1.p1  ORF type:complete len:348 (+),score=69.64 TRINITY_DN56666_c0_g1_i1:114-1157(+)
MAAGTKKTGKKQKPRLPAEVSQKADDCTSSSERPTWVERPLEPVVANGRGMRVLGFVPIGGLKTTPLRKPPSSAGVEKCLQDSHTSGVVKGASSWKKGRPVYEHGNYSRYYGYRHADGVTGSSDTRLTALIERLGNDLFAGKEILDIGCNAGLVSLEVARSYGARRVVGQDIDLDLIQAAKENAANLQLGGGSQIEFRTEDILTSPLRRPPNDTPERFDVVLCLSVTKWVHFARGDTGIRNLFKRCMKRLKHGGVLVLEPQEWSSYKKKRHLTPAIREMVASIELRPEAFDEHLVSLGLEQLGTIEPPADATRNFQRSLRLFRRPVAADDSAGDELEAEASRKKFRT